MNGVTSGVQEQPDIVPRLVQVQVAILSSPTQVESSHAGPSDPVGLKCDVVDVAVIVLSKITGGKSVRCSDSLLLVQRLVRQVHE